jgi:predicted ATP-grasp superfamily ATP-dependent carboligase
MSANDLNWYAEPDFSSAQMLLGFSGWMDGGEVSTGSVRYLIDRFSAPVIADIDPSPFYIYNVPGPMEIAGLFRPHVKIEGGVVRGVREPLNRLFAIPEQGLVVFEGKEPNLNWERFAECVLAAAERCSVERICFVGSVSSLLPHTRPPYFYSAVSEESLLPWITEQGLSPTDYEGPASFITYLSTRARLRGIPMATVVAGIPAYVQGRNEKALVATVRKAADLLALSIDTSELDARAQRFEEGLTAIVDQRPDLAGHIHKLERAYDDQVAPEEDQGRDDDLRRWFKKQGLDKAD